MAIPYGRLEYIKRSQGRSICAKAAYNARARIYFEGNAYVLAETFDFSKRPAPVYHAILLPDHVDKSFEDIEFLWNTAEKKETRINSQLGRELVLALPDDECITLEDRIEMTNRFFKENFVSKGFGVQVDIHHDGKGNWHVHGLITIRRFKENGLEFEDKKPRDIEPSVRNGFVILAEKWGKKWGHLQNFFFEEKGLELRTDPEGVVPQKHLGPVRMRGRATALMEENDHRIALNQIESKDISKILSKITETNSVFTIETVERFLQKHVDQKEIEEVRNEFWKQKEIISLLDAKTNEMTGKFSTSAVIEEEKKILRLADRIQEKDALKVPNKKLEKFVQELTQEQKIAFQNILKGKRLSCIEGHAGTGKSYLLNALKNAYESEGYTVRAFGPDNATAAVLKEKGFETSENIYQFLFALKNGKREIRDGKEILMLDESSKLGNRPLLEFLKVADKHNVQVVFSGCTAQLASVERGGMFKIFCEKYGCQNLFEIQRQKDQQHRKMVQNLAYGRMAEAINILVTTGGIKWAATKQEAMEELVKKWIGDSLAFPNDTSLILAHSNDEVRALNETVRFYRKEIGELKDKEYLCETAHGRIYVSAGDKIEFRKKNAELNVMNGTAGILIKASEKEFIVLVNEGKETRRVIFDPTEYTNFQLGYATTYFRSQGRTVERCYVLSSPQINKEKFYVGFTRHARKVYLYVSRTDATCLSDLKRQAHRACTRETTLDFLTKSQIENQREIEERKTHIQDLKTADSIFSRIKGYALASADNVISKIGHLIENSNDRRQDKDFFNPKIGKEAKGKVTEAPQNNVSKYAEAKEVIDSKEIVQQTLKQQQALALSLEKTEELPNSMTEKKQAWKQLPDPTKQLFTSYYKSIEKASVLYTIVQAEAKGVKEKEIQTPHFKEWQQACGERNESAHKIIQTLSKPEIGRLLWKERVNILNEQATRHESFIQRQNNTQVNIEDKLKENLDVLLHCLFPEGPTRRERMGLRFGSKGSLSVTCRGENGGFYYDFERGEGGGSLKLIQRTLGGTISDSKKWANNFLGEASEKIVPSQFSFKKQDLEKENDWISLKANPSIAVPSLKEISSHLNMRYDLAAKYPYRDDKGDVLFYTLRLVDKHDSTNKIILPLSYGFWKGREENPQWSLKGYQTHNKPLYNLQEIQNNPQATVLIVEGEKTAEAASQLLSKENFACITWSGGAAAVLKSDWTSLYGRNVIIWPDNDLPGYKAGETICSELRKIGVKSLEMVDKEILSKEFPQKWDLADPLPEGKQEQTIRDLLLSAKQENVGIEQLIAMIDPLRKDDPKDRLIEKLRVNEVLWRVEERLRVSLEQKFGSKTWEVNNGILEEASKIIEGRKAIDKALKEEFSLNDSLVKKLSYQTMLYQAETGSIPSKSQIDEMKQAFSTIGHLSDNKSFKEQSSTITNELREYSFDKAFASLCHISNKKDIIHVMQKEMDQIAINVAKIEEIERQLQTLIIEKSKQKEFKLSLSY